MTSVRTSVTLTEYSVDMAGPRNIKGDGRFHSHEGFGFSVFGLNVIKGKSSCQFPGYATFHFIAFAGLGGRESYEGTPYVS